MVNGLHLFVISKAFNTSFNSYSMRGEGWFVPKDGESPRREFLKTAAVAAGIALGTPFLFEKQVLASPEIEKRNTFKEGMRYLKHAAQHTFREELTVFSADDLDTLETAGEWMAEEKGTNNSVSSVGLSVETFIEEAIKDGRKVAVQCHTHPASLEGLENKQKHGISRLNFFRRKPKEYPMSEPPSFNIRALSGDAFNAYSLNKQYADKIDLRYRVFDKRGVWKYNVDSNHKFWKDYERIDAQYNMIYGLLSQDDATKFALRRSVGSFKTWPEIVSATLAECKGNMDENVEQACVSFLAEYEECLEKPHKLMQEVLDKWLFDYMNKSKHQE